MEDEARYGDSEYSARAEELFALYLRLHEAGEGPDFEALLEEHPEQADELEGLHVDWDNVRGLVARLEQARAHEREPEPSPTPADPPAAREAEPAPETPVEGSAPPEAAQEPAPEPTEAPAEKPRRRRSPALVLGLSLLALTAAGLAAWALDLLETTRVLAAETHDLRLDGERARAELERAREVELRLARRGERLAQELDSAEAGQERLERQLYGVAPLLPAYVAAEEAEVEVAHRRVAELARGAWLEAGTSILAFFARD